MNIKPTGRRAFVKPVENKIEVPGKVVVNPNDIPDFGVFRIIAITEGYLVEGDFYRPEFKEGDQVFISAHAGFEVDYAGDTFKVIDLDDIIGKVTA